jgi:hypothetical protein
VTVERAHPRYAHEAAVTFRVGTQTFQGRTTNVSRGGLCADLADPITVGLDIEVDMRLVFEDEKTSDALRLPGRVVWCTEVDEGCQIGIAFRPLKQELAELLALFLKYLGDGEKPARSKRESNLDKRFG